MPVDTFAVSALASELSVSLEGARIDKLHMPGKTEIHITGRARRGPFRLLLSAHPQRARAHLTTAPRENPQQPPMLCMLLRKHLTGARFTGLSQPHLERVLHFYWDAADEMGVLSRKTLTVEMIGRHSNIILTGADGRVVDCLRRVDTEMSPERPVLPGLFYKNPPPQKKADPTAVTRDGFSALHGMKPPGMPDDEWLGITFTALHPIICRDIANSDSNMHTRFFEVMSHVMDNSFTPYFIKDNTDFVSIPLSSLPQIRFNGTFSELLDALYTSRDQSEHIRQRASALTKTAKNNREKLLRKTGFLKEELTAAKNREHLRQDADLLMANLHRVSRGEESVTVGDFYNDDLPKTIVLDVTKSPQQNAASLYKSYSKAKNAETALNSQLVQAERDIWYWESILDQLSRAGSERELDEIREEISPRRRSPRVKAQKLSQPQRYRSSSGMVFRAGRNNRQNDLLTMKMASRNDIWLHVQKIPGCHVVIETNGTEPDGQTLYEAASVAALFSAAAASPKVPVDYTAVKYVKKPPNAKPGMVVYDKFKTILAKPDNELAEKLRTD
jgi:predicted ribosome quality control (RQC) complex YloA/Tae2 family protein